MKNHKHRVLFTDDPASPYLYILVPKTDLKQGYLEAIREIEVRVEEIDFRSGEVRYSSKLNQAGKTIKS